MRKLASIRKIKNILPHPNADLLELAMIDGWQCVVKKGEFSVGDAAIYFEIDSFLPLEPEFEFLKKSNYKKMGTLEGIRLKTIRLRGEISQGLALPYHKVERFFKENPFETFDNLSFEVGSDVTNWLGVKKYDPPVPAQLAGAMAGNFPSFIRKTDQERVQNIFDSYTVEFTDNNDVVAEQLKEIDPVAHADRIEELLSNRTRNPKLDMEFEVSLKLDGTSCTYFVCDPQKFKTKKLMNIQEAELPDVYFGVCGRNFEISEDDNNTYWATAKKNEVHNKMKKVFKDTGRSLAVQGELMGPKIQGNRENFNNFQFFVFDVWDIDEQRYLTASERELIIDMLELQHVPILHKSMKVFQEFKSIEDFLKFAEGASINHAVREGVVFKSNTLLNSEPVSFKAISNLFLLKGGN